MSIVNQIQEVLHNVRVKLYPNYLPTVEGKYIARTDSDATLNIPQVCAALKNRGGYGGDYDDLVEGVKQFLDEAVYQLCNGFAVNFGFFTAHINIGGTFNSVNDIHDHEKHKISFRFRALPKLLGLIKHINVEIEGIADASGWIDEFHDMDEDSVNTLYIPGDQFILHGSKIKIAGDDPGVGVFFVPAEDPSKAVKVTRIAENTSSKIIGIAPKTGHLQNRIEVRTKYSGSGGNLLKTVRIIAGDFTLEEN